MMLANDDPLKIEPLNDLSVKEFCMAASYVLDKNKLNK